MSSMIAGVTAALSGLLTAALAEERLSKVLDLQPVVTLRRPAGGDASAETGLRLFLYRVAENAAMRNLEPSRGDGTPSLHRAALAVDLHYLVTSVTTSDLYGEVLLGSALRALHDTPVLTFASISDALERMIGSDGGIGSTGAPLMLSVTTLPVDMLSQLFTSLQVPLQPCVTVQVSGVVID